MPDDNKEAESTSAHVKHAADQRSTRMPPGIPYIIGNEAAERFSYYGMRGILLTFMTKHLLDASGDLAVMSDADAKTALHIFMAAVYTTPILGAILSDGWLGKYRTILFLSIVYCLGHLALALDETRLGLVAGLSLIAIGAGGIKPCVSAHVGDQFGTANQHLIERVFTWFYFSINFGAFISSLLTPWLLAGAKFNGVPLLAEDWRARVAFGVPGVLMIVATLVFFIGRKKFVQIPPGGQNVLREVTSRDGTSAILKLISLYAFLAIFWCLYDQTASSWVLQAKKMDLHFLGFEWEEAQMQAINPVMILIFVPLFSLCVYPFFAQFTRVTPLRKIATGYFLAAIAFLITALIEQVIAAGARPSVGWQLIPTAVMTAGEVLVSVTFLEFSYTQAPKSMKSVVMGLYFLAVAAGNLVTAVVSQVAEGLEWSDREQFLFYMGLQFVSAALFIPVAYFYKERSYISDEKEAPAA